LLSKYVGKQYLDNAQDENVTLDDYFINDLKFSYQINPKAMDKIELGLLVNNFLDVKYSSNGYSYGGTPYFYPQAGINFMVMLSVKI
jgi:iron complex outermembrane receptor protein